MKTEILFVEMVDITICELEKICRSGKNKGHKRSRKVKSELNPALVMIDLNVKINIHSSNVKQVIVIK